MTSTNVSTLPTLKIDLTDHPYIKDDVFEVTINFPQRINIIEMVAQYCEHQNITTCPIYPSQKPYPFEPCFP